MKPNSVVKFILPVIFWLVLPRVALSDKLNDQRLAFLQAEKYLAAKNDAGFVTVSSSLTDYPLYPYLRYLWLSGKLDQTDQVLAFLSSYQDTRFAHLLRAKWLAYLAEHQRWPEFIKYYEVSEDSANDCQYQWARFQTGQQQQALLEAKRLWLQAKKSDKNCQLLFTALVKSPLISSDLVWQRLETALENNAMGLASATIPLLNIAEAKEAKNWLLVHQNPELVSNERFWQQKNTRSPQLFAYAIKRLAKNDLNKALVLWEKKPNDFPSYSQAYQSVERKIGLSLLNNKDNRAYAYLNKALLTVEEDRAAKVRAALLEQNWQHVNSALSELTASEQQQPKWQYWLARALDKIGKKEQAKTVYSTLAKDRSYYGFLAADTLNTPYQILDVPVKATENELKQVSEYPDIKASQEFKMLGRDEEARKQWFFVIKKWPKEKRQLAAKLAQQWQWNQVAIITLVKADYWDDIALRFPLTYLSAVQTSAMNHHIEPQILYGLIRQESMLDPYAVSSVGALGLMQLMPQTAKSVAKTLQQPWQSASDLFKPDVNIQYGGAYLRTLLNQFGGHIALAGAAYNAGPSRAKKWLPMSSAVRADIWIETIPFNETRKYVTNILSYTIIYQQRLKKNNLKLMDLLKDIKPE